MVMPEDNADPFEEQRKIENRWDVLIVQLQEMHPRVDQIKGAHSVYWIIDATKENKQEINSQKDQENIKNTTNLMDNFLLSFVVDDRDKYIQ